MVTSTGNAYTSWVRVNIMKALFQCIMCPLRNLSSPVTLRCSQPESLLQGAVDELPDLTLHLESIHCSLKIEVFFNNLSAYMKVRSASFLVCFEN